MKSSDQGKTLQKKNVVPSQRLQKKNMSQIGTPKELMGGPAILLLKQINKKLIACFF